MSRQEILSKYGHVSDEEIEKFRLLGVQALGDTVPLDKLWRLFLLHSFSIQAAQYSQHFGSEDPETQSAVISRDNSLTICRSLYGDQEILRIFQKMIEIDPDFNIPQELVSRSPEII